MEAYKRGGHTVWDCKYHVVWVTKYRYPVLGGDVGVRCRELLRETARAHEMVVHAGSINRGHVHMLLSIPQILLIEEYARVGVETLFARSPRATTPEDQLLLQFQGMIAEYERAQILERSRRGKRHRAQQGQVNVLSGAAFGYRYVREPSTSHATLPARR